MPWKKEFNGRLFSYSIGQSTKCRVHGAQLDDIKHVYSAAMPGSTTKLSCPAHLAWFELKVEVVPGSAKAYLNGAQFDWWGTEHDYNPQAGVLTANSYSNEIEYKNFSIQ